MNDYPVPTGSDLPPTADIVIAGGGIVGAATAFFVTRAGLRPVVLERRPALGTLTTPASTGAFRAQFDNREEIALVQESISLFENFAEEAELPGYSLDMRKQGYLWLTTRPEGVATQKALVANQHEWGLTDPLDSLPTSSLYIATSIRTHSRASHEGG